MTTLWRWWTQTTRSMEKGIATLLIISTSNGRYYSVILRVLVKIVIMSGGRGWSPRRKTIKCYFGGLKQAFKVLKIPNSFWKNHQVDNNMMFTLVVLQNMILNFNVGMQEYQSWTAQLKWQEQANMSGTTEKTIDEVLQSLDDAEDEDVNKEINECWCRPRVLKI